MTPFESSLVYAGGKGCAQQFPSQAELQIERVKLDVKPEEIMKCFKTCCRSPSLLYTRHISNNNMIESHDIIDLCNVFIRRE